jgi:hypothetical protein
MQTQCTLFAARSERLWVTWENVRLRSVKLRRGRSHASPLFVEPSWAHARVPTVMNYTRAQPWRMTSEIELQMASHNSCCYIAPFRNPNAQQLQPSRSTKILTLSQHYSVQCSIFQKLAFTFLKPGGYSTCLPPVLQSKILYSAHKLIIRFVCISEKTSNFCLFNAQWLVFLTEVASVYCAVRIWSLNKMDYVSSLKG